MAQEENNLRAVPLRKRTKKQVSGRQQKQGENKDIEREGKTSTGLLSGPYRGKGATEVTLKRVGLPRKGKLDRNSEKRTTAKIGKKNLSRGGLRVEGKKRNPSLLKNFRDWKKNTLFYRKREKGKVDHQGRKKKKNKR